MTSRPVRRVAHGKNNDDLGKRTPPIRVIALDHFYLDGAPIDTASTCPNRFWIQLGSANYGAKIAALLAAHAQGKRITMNYDAGWTSCDTPVASFLTEN